MNIILISKKTFWSDIVYNKVKDKFNCTYFTNDSYKDYLCEHSTEWVFFIHWSEIIPKKIYKQHRCVVFHTSNLPKGRGGSPIQNQILDNIVQTRVNAISVTSELDAGDVYCYLPLTLQGSIADIWLSIADRIYKLIEQCVITNPKPERQIGEVQSYKRNKNNALPTTSTDKLLDIHKFIQMLDGETYPKAFINIGNFRLEFSRSKFNGTQIIADVIITNHE